MLAGIINPMFKKLAIIVFIFITLLAGCQNPTPAPTSPPPSPQPSPIPATRTPTATPLPPTPTPVPNAALVNNEGITLAEYESELQRLQAALKENNQEMPAAEQKQKVLDELINQVLLAQSAAQSGIKLDDATLQQRLDSLATSLGGAQALEEWQKKNFYTDTTFRTALRRSIAAALMRDNIINAVPKEAEQVLARQILVFDQNTADRFYKLLEAGANFATLAYQVDAETGGDLGWFPRGYLVLPEIEKVTFTLEPGKYSKVTKTEYGFHIVQVIEHHQSRPLSVNAYRAAQRTALENWLKNAREKSQIKILV